MRAGVSAIKIPPPEIKASLYDGLIWGEANVYSGMIR